MPTQSISIKAVCGPASSEHEMEYENVTGTILPILGRDNFTFVLAKADGFWWVFEKTTGVRVCGESVKKKTVIDLAKDAVLRYSVRQLATSISQFPIVN